MSLTLHQKNKLKYKKLDVKSVDTINQLIDDDIVRGKTKDLLESLKEQKEEKGFLTENQRKLVRKIKKEFDENFPYQQELMETLVKLYNDGSVDGGHDFIPSVTEFFNENHSLTPLQLEQVINIVERTTGHNPDDE